MRTKLVVACALTAFVAVSGATAEATDLIHTSGIAKGAIRFNRLSPGVQKMVSAKATAGAPGLPGAPGERDAAGMHGTDGLNGADGVAGPAGPQGLKGLKGAAGTSGTNGATGLNGLKGDTGLNGLKGDKGDAGTNGAPGLKGDKGDAGTNGAPGLKGDKGDAGTNGAPGLKGDPGTNGTDGQDGQDGQDGVDAPAAQYGAAQVLVARHGGTVAAPTFNPPVWASFSAPLGSPVRTQAGGSFRFTCTEAQAPCEISVKAAVLGSTNHAVYPRILVYKSTPVGDGGPECYCEYADGSTGAAPMSLTAQAPTATLAYTAVPVNIGGSADCGIAGPAGDVNSIVVPSGYYDVQSTFSFLPYLDRAVSERGRCPPRAGIGRFRRMLRRISAETAEPLSRHHNKPDLSFGPSRVIMRDNPWQASGRGTPGQATEGQGGRNGKLQSRRRPPRRQRPASRSRDDRDRLGHGGRGDARRRP
jgi:hypothetical protein